MANLNIRIDDELKRQAEALFSDLGMNMSTAVTVFLKQSLRDGGIPFDLRVGDSFYSAENQAYLKNAIAEYESGRIKTIKKSMAELEGMADE